MLVRGANGGLLERAGELGVARQALHEAMAGDGQAVVVVGAAGMGKSALLGAVRGEAVDAGFRVLGARGELLEHDFPWGAVRSLFAGTRRERQGAAALADIALSGAQEDAGSLFAALHGLYWLAVELAQERPLALFVDDAHWVDGLSLRWLAYLAARIGDEPLLLVVAARPGPFEGDEGAWASLSSHARVIELGPLSEIATATLLENHFDERPDPRFAADCRQLTGGNPLLLGELARAIDARGFRPNTAGVAVLERTPRAALTPNVALRLHRLGPEALAVARALAVLAPHATPARLAHLADLDTAAATLGTERLAADGLIATEPAIDFVHPLVRTAAYEDLRPPTRGAWHANAARLLRDEHVDLDITAGHVLLADPSRDQSFVALLREAARRAIARAAPETASGYLNRALAEPPSTDDRVQVLMELGQAELAIKPQDAVTHFQQALTAANCLDDDLAARIGLSHALSFAGRFAEATDVLEEGLAQKEPSDQALDDALIAALLNAARWDVDVRPRCGPHIEALRRRDRSGEELSPELRANLAVELLAAGTDREGALRQAEAALRDAATSADREAMWVPMVITPLACAGAMTGARQINAHIVSRARAAGQRSTLSIALSASAKMRLWIGDVPGALVDGEDALFHAETPISVCYAVMFLAEARRLRDEADLGWSILSEHDMTGLLPQLWPFPQLLAERGWLRFLCGDSNGALEDLYACGRLLLRYGLHCQAVVPWRGRTALVLASLGHRDQALRLADMELRLARAWGETRTVVDALNVAAAVMDGDTQRALLQEALALCAESDYILLRVDTLCALGAALRRRGRRREAREYLVEAQTLAHESGAFAARRRAQQELLAAGGRPRRPAARGRDALTPSETRVAQLAAEGRSNPEIAQLLFVTRRTVETHLTSAYSKLGVRGRESLAEALR